MKVEDGLKEDNISRRIVSRAECRLRSPIIIVSRQGILGSVDKSAIPYPMLISSLF